MQIRNLGEALASRQFDILEEYKKTSRQSQITRTNMKKTKSRNITIPKGQDYLATIVSDQYIEISSELLGPKMDTFSRTVTLIGAPLNPPIGNTDTIMERLEDGETGKEIATRLVAFANVSAAPVQLEGKGPLAGFFDLYVTLSPTKESPGSTIYYATSEHGGTFESKATFWPLFEFRPLGGGQSIFVDTGKVPVPGFPMNIGSAGGTWSVKPPFPNAVRSFRAKPFFYQSLITITAKRDGQTSPVIPMRFAGDTIAACKKIQAQLTSRTEIAALGRVNFPFTKEDANQELI
jgi:hypothetical protein